MDMLYEEFQKMFIKYGVMAPNIQKFKRLKRNNEKVNFVETILIKNSYIEEFNTRKKLKVEKSGEKSAEFRTKGNGLFFEKNYWEALELYNKSIAFAEANSENLSIGYANRSAVLFQLKLYKECLENIKLAKNAQYPKRLFHKIDKREEDCLRLLSTQENLNGECFDFTFKPHPVIPEIADGIYMKYTEDKGRSIFTKRALKVGECVSIQKPFCSVLYKNAMYTRCNNCNLENFTLMPCQNCTCAMFCSEKCINEAERYHKFECPIIDFLHSTFFLRERHRLALRMTFIAISLFETFNQLEQFYNKPQNKNQNLFTLDYKNFNEKEYFRAIWGLLTHEEKMSVENVFCLTVEVVFLRYYLLRYTPLKEVFSGKTKPNCFTEILFRHMIISFALNSLRDYDSDKCDDSFALAITSFSQVINHSCAPNTMLTGRGTKMYTFVTRPIPAGTEIFSNYNEKHFCHFPKLMRQMELQNYFYFNCKCEACEGNYPMLHQLDSSRHVPEIIEADLELLYNYSLAEKHFPVYCAFLEKYHKYYPCSQIYCIEYCLRQCLFILVRNGSIKEKLTKKCLN